ncbi:MAG: PAS domain-containing sensor histidine kinase [Rhodospirillaceae bacterium]|nr:PAS domain-containing sensor histidine kinase [Rhodospirillaceae bacterium]
MPRFGDSARPVLILGAVLALPAHVALAALIAMGELDVWAGVAAMALIQLAVMGLGLLFNRDVATVAGYVDALVNGAPADVPRPITRLARGFALAVARLHRTDQNRCRVAQRQLEATDRLIDSLTDPLLLVGQGRRVVRLNTAATAMLGARAEGADLAETIRHPEVLRAVDAVLGGGESRTVEFTRPVPIEQVLQARVQAYSAARGSAAASGDGGEGGRRAALVTFHDITAIRRSEQMRADFVANASHELRTPLSTLMGFIETLRGPARDDADARDRFLAIMDEQSGRMSRLVNDLLSLSRIELDEHMPPAGAVDIASVVRGVVATLELRAARRRMRLVVKVEHDLPPVFGESDQLTQVIQNLADNAINYGREGTDVAISAGLAPFSHYRGDHAVVVTVADQGEGIPKSHLPRLTERFYRVDPARSRAIGGTGLGLAIVKHIVSRHRGRLTIESEIGAGSTFAVALPAQRPVVPGLRIAGTAPSAQAAPVAPAPAPAAPAGAVTNS